jgi:dCTP deaminase
VILSDRSIREQIAAGRLVIEPFDLSLVQPSSIDLRLDRRFLVFRNTRRAYLDVKEPADDLMERVEPDDGKPIVLHPSEFVLGSTVETVTIPDDLVARLEGRSSVGRLGIVIHSTAGYIDPGFSGQITLEIANLATIPVLLYPGMRIAQISFSQMTSPAEKPYGGRGLGSKYQGQGAPTPSRLYLDFDQAAGEQGGTKQD